MRANSNSVAVQEKKYTETHEWIELSEDGKTGTLPNLSVPAPLFSSLPSGIFTRCPLAGLVLSSGVLSLLYATLEYSEHYVL